MHNQLKKEDMVCFSSLQRVSDEQNNTIAIKLFNTENVLTDILLFENEKIKKRIFVAPDGTFYGVAYYKDGTCTNSEFSYNEKLECRKYNPSSEYKLQRDIYHGNGTSAKVTLMHSSDASILIFPFI